MTENVLIFIGSIIVGGIVDLYKRIRKLEGIMKDKVDKQDVDNQIELHLKSVDVVLHELKEDSQETKKDIKFIINHLLTSKDP